jgi:hypothetical protein
MGRWSALHGTFVIVDGTVGGDSETPGTVGAMPGEWYSFSRS